MLGDFHNLISLHKHLAIAILLCYSLDIEENVRGRFIMQELFGALQAQMQQEKNCLLATITSGNEGNAGARLLLGSDGCLYCNMAAGALQQLVIEAGADMLQNQCSGTQHFDSQGSTVYFQFIPARSGEVKAFAGQVLALLESATACWLITDLSEGEQCEMYLLKQGDSPDWLDADTAAQLQPGAPTLLTAFEHELFVEPLL